MAHRDRGEYDAAIADCDQVLAANPADAEMLCCRGYCRCMKRDHASALTDFSGVLALAPDHLDGLKFRGSTYVCLGRYREALPDLTRALELDPADHETWGDRGNARRELGELEGSIADYTRAIELRPTYRRAYWGRGLSRRAHGDDAGAVDDYTKYLELDPRASNLSAVLADRAWSLRKLSRYSEARDDLTRAIELEPGHCDDHWNRALCRSALGDLQGALADYRQAVALKPELSSELGPTIRALEASVAPVPAEQPSPRARETTAAPAPAGQPAPATPLSKQKPKSLAVQIVAGVMIAIGVVMVIWMGATLAVYSVVKGTDVIYCTAFMVSHWNDERAFPPGAHFCNGLYCRRTDTIKKHVSGSEGRQSEHFAYFCPEHKRSNYLFFLDLSHLGTFCWYAYCASLLLTTALWYGLAVTILGGVVILPALPFVRATTRWKMLDALMAGSFVIGILLAIPSWLIYVWW